MMTIGIAKSEPATQQAKTMADKWWEGLKQHPIHDCCKFVEGALNGRICTTEAVEQDFKACYTEGLICREGFERWWESMPVGGYGYRRILAYFDAELDHTKCIALSMGEAVVIWSSIHAFKARQAKGEA